MDPAVDAGADMVAAGKQGGARGRTNGAAGVEVGKTCATGHELVERRSFHGTTITADVLPPEIVGQQHHDVRTLRGMAGSAEHSGENRKKISEHAE